MSSTPAVPSIRETGEPPEPLRLLAVLAHPDDESLGCGGVLARYAEEGAGGRSVETWVVTATRGEAGRHGTDGPHPGRRSLGWIREAELRAAASELGVAGVEVLGYPDGGLDGVDPVEAAGRIATHLRRIRPQVVLTFAPDGAYGHPDHIAVSQLTSAALLRATAPGDGGGPHRVSKLYHLAWDAETWSLYQKTFRTLTSTVDGVERKARAWPGWAITTRVDCTRWWPDVWRAVRCHTTQMSIYGALEELGEDEHRRLWGHQTFYRAMSLVNGGREVETDLFDGLLPRAASGEGAASEDGGDGFGSGRAPSAGPRRGVA